MIELIFNKFSSREIYGRYSVLQFISYEELKKDNKMIETLKKENEKLKFGYNDREWEQAGAELCQAQTSLS